MKLEYLEAPGARPARVLLLHELAEGDVEALCEAAEGLGAGRLQHVRLVESPGGVSLLGELAETDAGVEPVAGDLSAFRCVLSRGGWRRVRDLLEPFAEASEGERFQYLTETGEIEWIVSTHRGW
jgi:hypothetical protein